MNRFPVIGGTTVPNLQIEEDIFTPLCEYIPEIGDELFHTNFGRGFIEEVEGCPSGIVVHVRFQKKLTRIFYGATIIYKKQKN